MYRVIYSGLPSLIMEVHNVLAQTEKKPLVIDFFGAEHNPHDALGVYRFLEMHIANGNLEVYARFQSYNTFLNLVAVAALPPENRLLSPSGVTVFDTPEAYHYGTAKDAVIAAKAHTELLDRCGAAVVGNYEYTMEELSELMLTDTPVPNTKLVERGFKLWTELQFDDTIDMDIVPNEGD